MALVDAYWTALNGLITATWTDVTQVLKRSQANRHEWLEDIAAGVIDPPYAIVGLGEFEDDPQWGLANDVFRAPTEIYYIRARKLSAGELSASGSVQAVISAKLFDLRTALVAYSGSGFQVIERPSASAEDSIEANQVIYRLEAPYQAGMLYARPIVGETP